MSCLCIKSDGQKCTRKSNIKPNTNNQLCWQHQSCKNIKSAPSIVTPSISPILASQNPNLSEQIPKNIRSTPLIVPPKKGQFQIDGPIIANSNIDILHALYIKNDEPINKINLIPGNYNLKLIGKLTVFSHDSVSPKIINDLVEQIKLHNPIKNAVIYDYNLYLWVLQALLGKAPPHLAYEIQSSKIFDNQKFIIMKWKYYESLKNTDLSSIINSISNRGSNRESKDLCYMDQNKIICKDTNYSNIALIDNKILIVYGKYGDGLYNKNLLKKDEKGLYYKTDDYDILDTKDEFITKVLDTYEDATYLGDLLDIDIWHVFRKKMMEMDVQQLKRTFPDVQ